MAPTDLPDTALPQTFHFEKMQYLKCNKGNHNKMRYACILKHFILFYFIYLFSTFIYFWDRERQSMNGAGAEREGDTESETGSRL